MRKLGLDFVLPPISPLIKPACGLGRIWGLQAVRLCLGAGSAGAGKSILLTTVAGVPERMRHA